MPTNRSVSEKMGIKTDSRAILINASEDVKRTLKLPDLHLSTRLAGAFDYIHLFAENLIQLSKKFPQCKRHLRTTGMLWVSWPKSGQMETDLNIRNVIKTGYDLGLVESKTIGIDATWSAIKFTYPKKGKQYNNSYGKLKQ